ncbi:MAG TPA: hypothetical protein PLE35_08585, partial [Lentisphaeria bacterium]|nr:hypothetical protein [Lentisphaeria bacterium]
PRSAPTNSRLCAFAPSREIKSSRLSTGGVNCRTAARHDAILLLRALASSREKKHFHHVLFSDGSDRSDQSDPSDQSDQSAQKTIGGKTGHPKKSAEICAICG